MNTIEIKKNILDICYKKGFKVNDWSVKIKNFKDLLKLNQLSIKRNKKKQIYIVLDNNAVAIRDSMICDGEVGEVGRDIVCIERRNIIYFMDNYFIFSEFNISQFSDFLEDSGVECQVCFDSNNTNYCSKCNFKICMTCSMKINGVCPQCREDNLIGLW